MDGEGQWRMFGEHGNRRQTLLNMPWRRRPDGSGPRPERIPQQRVGGSSPLSRSNKSNGFSHTLKDRCILTNLLKRLKPQEYNPSFSINRVVRARMYGDGFFLCPTSNMFESGAFVSSLATYEKLEFVSMMR